MTSALKWGLLGAAFGACFPALAVWSLRSHWGSHVTDGQWLRDPLLWLVASAPLFLGLVGTLGGRQHDRVRRFSKHLETIVQERTQDLQVALERAAEQASSRGELLDRLNHSALVLERAIDSLDDAFAMYDADERLVVCNRAYIALNSIAGDVVSARPSYEQLVRTQFAAHPEFLKNLPADRPFEEWVQQRLAEFRNPKAPTVMWNGERWIRLNDKKTPDGGTVCIRTDVTSIKLAEFEARIQEQRLELAATSARIGIWETDLETQRVTWDARTEAIHGFDPGTFPGTLKAWKSRIHPGDLPAVEASIAESLAHAGSQFHDTYRVVLPGGDIRHVERRGGYSKDLRGNLVRRLGINQDITEHVEKAETLRAALATAQAATRAKTEFLATMSHEIRTPMNGVIGMTELLLDTDLDAKQREHAETIRASGEALLAIINDILDFSKIEAGKLTLEALPFSVAQVATECIALFANQAHSKGLELIYTPPETATDVVGDSGRLRQILLNLVSNALKFTQVGHVHVRVSVQALTGSVLTIEVEVADTGIGMPPEYLSHLGEAFSQADASTTRRFGGTGLGLSICRSLIQLMHGTLSAHSTLGEGTRFVISLPLPIAEATPSARTQSIQAGLAQRLHRVLVAEDNVVNQRVIVSMLRKFVDHVDLAVDGQAAFEQFKLENYDCVLMDGQMPRVDGLAATRMIRTYEAETHKPRTPIIALTASAMASDREMFLASGMDEYITKPVRSRDLIAALKRVDATPRQT